MTAAPPSPTQPVADFGDYRLGSELGHGASGRVFECTRSGNDETFAVKVVDLRHLRLSSGTDRALKNLRREVKILKSLPMHPNIVRMIDALERDEFFYLVLELVSGGDLFSLLMQRPGPRPRLYEREAAYVFAQLVEGLAFLHGRGVVHRDLKLENILISSENRDGNNELYRVKITDFGLSKAIGSGLIEAHSVVGTRRYAAPEILSGGNYDFRVDLWSLGVVLYILLVGRYPHDKPTHVKQEVLEDLVSRVDASTTAKTILDGLLRLDPTRRYSLDRLRELRWTGEERSVRAAAGAEASESRIMIDLSTPLPTESLFGSEEWLPPPGAPGDTPQPSRSELGLAQDPLPRAPQRQTSVLLPSASSVLALAEDEAMSKAPLKQEESSLSCATSIRPASRQGSSQSVTIVDGGTVGGSSLSNPSASGAVQDRPPLPRRRKKKPEGTTVAVESDDRKEVAALPPVPCEPAAPGPGPADAAPSLPQTRGGRGMAPPNMRPGSDAHRDSQQGQHAAAAHDSGSNRGPPDRPRPSPILPPDAHRRELEASKNSACEPASKTARTSPDLRASVPSSLPSTALAGVPTQPLPRPAAQRADDGASVADGADQLVPSVVGCEASTSLSNVHAASAATNEALVHMVVPDRLAGSLLGKAGARMKQVKAATGCNTWLTPRDGNANRSLVLVGSPPRNIAAQAMFVDMLSSELAAHGQQLQELTLVMFLPSEKVGPVVGKNGSGLQHIHRASCTRVNVLREEVDGKRLCTIIGTFENVLVAERLIFGLLGHPVPADCMPRGSINSTPAVNGAQSSEAPGPSVQVLSQTSSALPAAASSVAVSPAVAAGPAKRQASSAGALSSATPGVPAVSNSRSSNVAPIPRKRRRIDSSAASRGGGAAAPSEAKPEQRAPAKDGASVLKEIVQRHGVQVDGGSPLLRPHPQRHR